MRVGVDNVSPGESTARRAPGGMRGYLTSLIQECSALRPADEYRVFTADNGDCLLDPLPQNVRMVRMRGVPVNRGLRALYQQTVLPRAIGREGVDVFLATATVAPLRARVPVVLVVQFLQFYDLPDSYGRLRTRYLRAMVPLSVKHAAAVIVFTDHAKRNLIERTGVDAGKVHVVPHGVFPQITPLDAGARHDEAMRVRARWTGGRPYVVYVSATYGYKNHLRLVRAFGALRRRGQPHVLLLVGAEDAVRFETIRQEASAQGIADDVVIAGRVDDVAAVYRAADLLVFPSLYETFGFPPLEAMAVGCPVVTSNLGSMAEVAGDAALQVDPRDEQQLAAAMERALTDPGLRESLIARGRDRAMQFTFRRTAEGTLRVLGLVAARGR